MQDVKIGRNDPCPCGSGKKYKKCCLVSVLSHSDIISPAWRTLRQTEGELVELMLDYLKKKFPKEIVAGAQDEFLMGEEWSAEPHEGLSERLFIPWFLYDWDVENVVNSELQKQPIALHFLQHKRQRLTDMQRRFIETICQTHFSFYVVLDVVPKQSIKLKDILLQTEHIVSEYQATEHVHRGDIIFTRILTLDDISICIGTAPRIIPSHWHVELLDYRKKLEDENTSPLTVKLLRSKGDYIREIYFDIMERQINPEKPVLHNTDGDLYEFCTVNFKLHIKPDEAFNKLLPLTLSDDPDEFLSDAKIGKNGQLKQIKLPWLKAGNQKHKHWENTLMGNITISENKLTVEVNSQARADDIITLLNKYLGDGVVYQKTRIESVDKKISSTKTVKVKKSEKPDFSNSPEAQEILREFTNKHWNNWLNESIPLLDGLTPMQAAKTRNGRDKLEAILLDFERKSARDPNNFTRPNISELREKLGLNE